MAWLSASLLFLAGCACSQVTSYFLGISDGGLRLTGFATVEEAAVVLEPCLTQANWVVRADYQTERVVLQGKSRAGYPIKIVLTRARDGKGETWVQATLDMPAAELIELKALWDSNRQNARREEEEKTEILRTGAKK